MAVDEALLRSIPKSTGVYLFRDGNNNVIYVGKAISLNNRVRNHFQKSNTYPKDIILREETLGIEFFVTANESEALILENNLIKQYFPTYNIRLKDDKSFPSVKVTVHEELPSIYITRKIVDDGSIYFGPYSNPGSIRRVLRYVKELFGIRYCNRDLNRKVSGKPCLNFQMKICSAPCSGTVGKAEYRRSVEQVCLFLEGDIDRLNSDLEMEMKGSSERLEYERAAVIRDRIEDIKRMSERQRVSRALEGNMDVVGTAIKGEKACVQLFLIRRGNLIGKEDFILPVPFGSSDSEVLTAFVEQRYFGKLDLAPRILISHRLTSKKFIEGWLQRKNVRSKIVVPRKAAEKDLVKLVLKNAEERLLMEMKLGKEVPALIELREVLGLDEAPERIEGIDISNISGDLAVGSLVSFYHGKPDKGEYRRFRIKNVDGIDDYAMVREVVRRRYSRSVKEGKDLPDLVLIDGGIGHLNSACAELEGMGIEIPVISIAKRMEEIFVPGEPEPLRLKRKFDALKLIKAVRDESHRFAITYHRSLRRKKVRGSVLEKIPGIGSARRKILLKKFGSVKRLREASADEIAETPSISEELANRIHGFLNEN